MKRFSLKLSLVLLQFCLVGIAWGNPKHPFDQIRTDPNLTRQLNEIVQAAIAHNFGQAGSLPKNLGAPFQQNLALFVTAKKGNKIVGCMGSLKPKQGNLSEEIVVNLQKAFSQDPRNHPIQASELPELEIYLTAIGNAQLISDIRRINPARDAIVLRHGNKEAVVLAGETKTLRYLLAFAKAKAGIRQGEPFQVYRLATKTLRVYPFRNPTTDISR